MPVGLHEGILHGVRGRLGISGKDGEGTHHRGELATKQDLQTCSAGISAPPHASYYTPVLRGLCKEVLSTLADIRERDAWTHPTS